MGKNQSASGLTNIIQYDTAGNISLVSGSTVLLRVSSSGAITTTGVISGSNALSSSYAVSASYAISASNAASASYWSGSITNAASASYWSGSITNALSASYAASASNASNTALFNSTASSVFATTGSNTFTGTQYVSNTNNAIGFSNTTSSIYTDGGLQVTKDAYISSSLYIKGNLTVYGTQSVSYITSSTLNISTNLITVNTSTPSVRFGGLAVQDSGSASGLTGSLLWDSQNNSWLYDNPSGSGNYDSAMVIMGPRNSSALGSEQGLNCNYLIQGHGHHHTTSSGIFHDGSTTCFPGTVCNSNTVINGSVSTPLNLTGTNTVTTFNINNINANGWGGGISVQTNTTSSFYLQTLGSLLGTTNQDATLWSTAGNGVRIYTNGNNLRLNIDSTGAACFACCVTVPGLQINSPTYVPLVINSSYGQVGANFALNGTTFGGMGSANNFSSDAGIAATDMGMGTNGTSTGKIVFATGTGYTTRMIITSAGITCFSSTVCTPVLFASTAIFSSVYCVNSYNSLSSTTSGQMGVLGHNAIASQATSNTITQMNNGYYGSFIRQYYNEGITFYTRANAGTAGDVLYGTSPVADGGERMRITSTGISCFACTICAPKIGYNGYNGVTAHDLVGHFDAGSTNIATLSGENAYTRVAAHIEWVSNYALAGTAMTMGYTIVDTRRGNNNTIWVNCACTVLAYGDSGSPTFGWSGGVLSVSVPGSVGLSARFRITTYSATLTPNI